MNTVNLIGRLTADPELRSTGSGAAVTNLRLAVDNGPDNPTAFFTVVVWGPTAIAVATHQRSGRLLGVTGRLSYDEWDKDGARQNRTYITASRLEFLDPPTPDGTQCDADAGAEP